MVAEGYILSEQTSRNEYLVSSDWICTVYYYCDSMLEVSINRIVPYFPNAA